jgi:FkbM family methyltransferase
MMGTGLKPVAARLARRMGLRRSAGRDYEARVERFYSRILSPGDVCVDVGAHSGRHTFPMSRVVGPSRRVFAFEPLPLVRAALFESLKSSGLDGMVTLSAAALSDFTGRSTFVVAEDAPEESGLRERTYNVPTATKRIDVDVMTLDGALPSDISAVRYIKIDCEGAEWSVLRGAAGTIDRLRPLISFEFGEAAYGAYGTDPAEVHRFFAGRDYVVLDILGRQLDEAAFSTSSVRQKLWDYVAVPSTSARLAGRALKARWFVTART